MFDYEGLYGHLDGEMNKAERLMYGQSLMTHAMCITGYDQEEGETYPRKWRIENSWGDSKGDKGYCQMTNAWFGEYVFQISVLKSDLPEELVPCLSDEPTVLPAWDPMGALA